MNAKISIEEYSKRINVSNNDLNGRSRKNKFSIPRQVYWYYLSKNEFPLYIICRQFGRKHSTVLHCIKNIRGFIEIKDKTINPYLEALEIFSH